MNEKQKYTVGWLAVLAFLRVLLLCDLDDKPLTPSVFRF